MTSKIPGQKVEKEHPPIALMINTFHAEYDLLFWPDYTGQITFDYGYKGNFSHNLDLFGLVKELGSGKESEDFLSYYFWKEVNPGLDVPLDKNYQEKPPIELYTEPEVNPNNLDTLPVINLEELDDDYEDLDAHELEFITGNRADFDYLLRLFILTEPGLAKATQKYVYIQSSTEKHQAGLGEWDSAYTSARLKDLIELALKEHQPYGYQFHYDDQSNVLVPQFIDYKLDEFIQMPAREKMNARRELRLWLIERNQEPAQFELENWEKIL